MLLYRLPMEGPWKQMFALNRLSVKFLNSLKVFKIKIMFLGSHEALNKLAKPLSS